MHREENQFLASKQGKVRYFYCPNCDRSDLEYDARNSEPKYFRCKHCNHRFYKKDSHGYSVGSGW